MRKTLILLLLLFLMSLVLACSDDGTKSENGDDPTDGDDADGDAPDGDAPDGDAPDGDAPDGDAPDGDAPDGDAPDGDVPDGDDPDGDDPDGDDPDGDDPDGDDPNGDVEHCCWDGASWDTIWPQDGQQAVYRVKTFLQEEKDLPATVDYTPVEWRGGMYSRFMVGTPEPGNDGLVIYFDRSVPWNPRMKGLETFSEDETEGPSLVQWYEDHASINLNQPLDTSKGQTHTVYTLPPNFDEPEAVEMTYTGTYASYDATIETPYGDIDGCMHIHVEITQPILGLDDPFTFTADVYLHPEHFFIGMTSAPGFIHLWLKETWQ